jgi:hypothetical protein
MLSGVLNEEHDTKNILYSWWVEDTRLFGKSDGIYSISNLRDPYVYTMALVTMLYGDKYCAHFKDAWLPLTYIVVTIGRVFN